MTLGPMSQPRVLILRAPGTNCDRETAFAFEVLDRLQPADDPAYDPREDLSVLRAIWTEKLIASGESLYEP